MYGMATNSSLSCICIINLNRSSACDISLISETISIASLYIYIFLLNIDLIEGSDLLALCIYYFHDIEAGVYTFCDPFLTQEDALFMLAELLTLFNEIL